jgi:hypothetical protein
MVMVSSLALSLLSPKVHADTILAKEFFVKAAFLYNFARLTEWPADTFKNDTDPVRLCLIGKDPFNDALRTIQNKKIKEHPLLIQRSIDLDNIAQCHILFISRSEENNILSILSSVKQHPILTISELPDFAEQGGHIRFFLSDEEKINLEINLGSINQAGLKISSRILTLAKIVSSKEAVKP